MTPAPAARRRTRAPGKVVVSGAYAVLEGAPAIVAAVDRFAVADGAREAAFVTDEVRAAVELGFLDRAPWFDASQLRTDDGRGGTRKLGLGSSAAILVASLAARWPGPGDEDALRASLLAPALAAHRRAQHGGSGLDVAASVRGGVLRFERSGDPLRPVVEPQPLPTGLVIEIFASDRAASTTELRGRVDALRERDPDSWRALFRRLGDGATAAAAATTAAAFVTAIAAQIDALGELGTGARAAIVTPEVEALRPAARAEAASFGPSGAGGGDVALFIGTATSSEAFRRAAAAAGLERLDAGLGARGVHAAAPTEG